MIFYYQFVKLGIFSIVFLFWDYRLRGSLMDDKHRGRPQRSFFRVAAQMTQKHGNHEQWYEMWNRRIARWHGH